MERLEKGKKTTPKPMKRSLLLFIASLSLASCETVSRDDAWYIARGVVLYRSGFDLNELLPPTQK